MNDNALTADIVVLTGLNTIVWSINLWIVLYHLGVV
jgi:hypothetical protein